MTTLIVLAALAFAPAPFPRGGAIPPVAGRMFMMDQHAQRYRTYFVLEEGGRFVCGEWLGSWSVRRHVLTVVSHCPRPLLTEGRQTFRIDLRTMRGFVVSGEEAGAELSIEEYDPRR